MSRQIDLIMSVVSIYLIRSPASTNSTDTIGYALIDHPIVLYTILLT